MWLPIGNLLVLYMVTLKTSEYHYQHVPTGHAIRNAFKEKDDDFRGYEDLEEN